MINLYEKLEPKKVRFNQHKIQTMKIQEEINKLKYNIKNPDNKMQTMKIQKKNTKLKFQTIKCKA